MSRKNTAALPPLVRMYKLWELMMWLLELRSIAVARSAFRKKAILDSILEMPRKNWRKFREFLVTIHATGFTWEDWVATPTHGYFQKIKEVMKDRTPEHDKVMTYFLKTPAVLASWTLESRRSYRIAEDLQVLLAATSLENVNW